MVSRIMLYCVLVLHIVQGVYIYTGIYSAASIHSNTVDRSTTYLCTFCTVYVDLDVDSILRTRYYVHIWSVFVMYVCSTCPQVVILISQYEVHYRHIQNSTHLVYIVELASYIALLQVALCCV